MFNRKKPYRFNCKIKTVRHLHLGKNCDVHSSLQNLIDKKTFVLKWDEMISKIKVQSVAKKDDFGELPNEDRFHIGNPIALSDGAGGVGLFTGEWAEYLCNNLPIDPITTHHQLCSWINSIWQPFCDNYQCVAELKGIGSRFLTEGSWATLIAIWFRNNKSNLVNWISFGDSVIFLFDTKNRRMEFCSMKYLVQFNEKPFLINWKEDPFPEGFSSGEFRISDNHVVILASDSISQYILIQYLLWEKSESSVEQIDRVLTSNSRMAGYLTKISNAYPKDDFFKITLPHLISSLDSSSRFKQFTSDLLKNELITFDDYTMLVLSV